MRMLQALHVDIQDCLCKQLNFASILRLIECCRQLHKTVAIYKKLLMRHSMTIQRFYRRRRLGVDTWGTRGLTLNTLKRYYVAKYSSQRLRDLPNFVIAKLQLDPRPAYASKPTEHFASHFYRFCDDYGLTKADLAYCGW
jgi:hypothetical protein